MKKLALFDIDKTIYNTQSFFPLVDNEIARGRIDKAVRDEVQEVLGKYKQGEYKYSEAATRLLQAFATNLKGQSIDDLYNDAAEFFQLNRSNFYSYFSAILPKLKTTHDVYLVTTNAQFLAQSVVDMFELTGYLSSEFEVQEGMFTGKIQKSLADGKAMVQELIDKYGKAGSIAVGDSENDISMLELVDHPICINANDLLKAHASKRGWPIITNDTAMRYFLEILQ